MPCEMFRRSKEPPSAIEFGAPGPATAHTRQPNTYLKLTVPTTQGSAGFSSEDGSASGGIPAIFGGGKPLLPRNIHAKTCIFTGKLLNIGTVRLTRMGDCRTPYLFEIPMHSIRPGRCRTTVSPGRAGQAQSTSTCFVKLSGSGYATVSAQQ